MTRNLMQSLPIAFLLMGISCGGGEDRSIATQSKQVALEGSVEIALMWDEGFYRQAKRGDGETNLFESFKSAFSDFDKTKRHRLWYCDGWGNPFKLVSYKKDGDSSEVELRLISSGKDGIFSDGYMSDDIVRVFTLDLRR